MRMGVDLRRLIGDLRQADGNVTFVIGAGASISAGIPSAPALVEEICRKFGHRMSGLGEGERGDYGRVMGCLTPSQREQLINPYLTGAKLNWGHIALAALVRAGVVKRVLTFNFDLLLEQALTLLGRHLAVYDFGVSPTKEVDRLVEPSIVHLHGQGYGMKLLNSEAETKAHCESLRPLIAKALKQSLTVVFGYGGKSDPVLGVMTEEYNSHHPFYWLGHDDTAGVHLNELLTRDDAEYLGGCDFDWVMTRLAEGLGAWPPPVLDNPMRHVLEVLKPTTDYPVGDEETVDTLTETRRRLGEFATLWDSGRTDEQRALESSMRSEGSAPLSGADPNALSDAARSVLAWKKLEEGNVLVRAAREIKGEAAAATYLAVAERCEAALVIDSKMPEALNNWGAALMEAARHLPAEAALERLGEVFEKYDRAVTIKPDFHEALYNWGNALLAAARHLPAEAALERLGEAFEKYDRAVTIKPDKHEALNNWGNALAEAAKHLPAEAALKRLGEAFEKYGRAVTIKPDFHEALNNWGAALMGAARYLPAEAALERLEEAFEKYDRAVTIKPDDHEALANWGTALMEAAARSSGAERDRALAEAEEKLVRYKALTGKTSYNLACLHALRGDGAAAVAALEACRADGELPSLAHLDSDTDLDAIRDDPAYRAFRALLGVPSTNS